MAVDWMLVPERPQAIWNAALHEHLEHLACERNKWIFHNQTAELTAI